MKETSFYNILNNTATESEKTDFYSILENDSQEMDQYCKLKNLFVLSQLNHSDYNKQQNESFNKFWKKTQNTKNERTLYSWMKYAAIFLIAILTGFVTNRFINNTENKITVQNIEYQSEKGSVSKIILEDGSSIWLSTNTNLKIDKNKKGEITASLNGEAYFDLIPNPDRKFIVDLGHFRVRDIGTKFNIRSYENEETISTALIDGTIELLNKTDKAFLVVKPGELINYEKLTKKITIDNNDNSISTAWTEGKFVFIDKTLRQICDELENWYNIEIQIEDEKLLRTKYTSVVKRSTTVQMVLKILSITDQIKYEIYEVKEGKDIIKIRK